nr:hypothetical protein Iba_scaffold7281CG0030 [Ipomoea batatas]GME21351.1 hypothetical protein Iba_scaffold27510CG0010 [Ipomoea batatas]
MALSVEDYEEAGLVLSAAELVEITEVSEEGVDLKGKQPLGIIATNNKLNTQQAPEMGTGNCAGGEKKGKTEWEIEMETSAVGKTEDQWPPGLWEFERDDEYYYFHWIFYCPDAFVLDSHLINSKFL